MVQVDIFWSFAIGAGFAAAAARQIKQKMESKNYSLLENKYFTIALLALSVFFAPSGVLLLWGHTSWETMHFWQTHEALSKWIVVLFAVTNTTQGALGFWWATKFIKQGRFYEPYLLTIIGYFCMFFILVHGWDGRGYQRFFTDTAEQWRAFLASGAAFTIPKMIDWVIHAKVARTLYILGIIMIPAMLYTMAVWIKKGYARDPSVDPAKAKSASLLGIIFWLLFGVFATALVPAIIASLLIHLFQQVLGSIALGWIAGWIVFLILAYFTLVRRKSLGHRFANLLTLEKA